MMNIKTLAAIAWFLTSVYWLVCQIYALLANDDQALVFSALAISALAMSRTYTLDHDNASS